MTTSLRAIPARILSIGLFSLVLVACNGAVPSATPGPSVRPSAPAPSSAPPSVGPTSSPSPTAAPTGFQAAGPMVLARLGARSALLTDGSILVVGNAPCVAAGEPTGSERTEVFDPLTGTWSEVGPLNKPRATPALVALPGGGAMVLGGTNPQSQPYSSTKLYAPAGKTWSDGPLMLRAGATQAVVLPNGDVLAVGPGRAELLAEAASAWRRVTPPPATVEIDRLLVLKGGVVIAAGQDAGSGPSFLRFDAAKGTWATITAPDVLRPQPFALTDGTLLVFGDDEGGSHIQRYDPATDTWSEPAQLATGRIRAQIAVLSDGRVLVAGGVELKTATVDGGTSVTEGAPLATSELYDPATDSWTAGPSLLAPRQGGQAITLADGSVVVFGGYTQSPPPDSNPDTGTPGPCPTPLATTERLAPAS